VTVKIAPSLLSADFGRLREEVTAVEAAGADLLHLDVMDGYFVPNITFGPQLVAALRPHSRLPFDVHLMIAAPERYVADFIAAGADIVTVHAEACVHLHQVLAQIKEKGASCGVALNPATPLGLVEEVLPLVDLVLLMTVNPGFGGQRFLHFVVPKVNAAAIFLRDRNCQAAVEVDGGVDVTTAPVVAAAGATVLVAGTAVFGAADRAAAVRALREAAEGRDFSRGGERLGAATFRD